MEKTLKITEEQAKKLYLEASANLKEILELNFGKNISEKLSRCSKDI